jgi:type I restriction enzyme, R subunit
VSGFSRTVESAKERTQAEVEVFILDRVFEALPIPLFSQEDKQPVAKRVYDHIWQQRASPEGHIAG